MKGRPKGRKGRSQGKEERSKGRKRRFKGRKGRSKRRKSDSLQCDLGTGTRTRGAERPEVLVSQNLIINSCMSFSQSKYPVRL